MKSSAKRNLLSIAFFLGSLAGWSQTSQAADCGKQLYQGVTPQLLNLKMRPQTTEICYGGYTVLYSGISKTPLWSAEHLSRDRVSTSRGMTRKNSFHPDPSLSADQRSELADYKGSGFDRGHMSPSGDMESASDQFESFSLANMIPQNKNNNEQLWKGIETTVRDVAESDGEVYTVTGPIFLAGQSVTLLNNRVMVPPKIFKAIYDPSCGTGAYIVDNVANSEWHFVSLQELASISGIDAFPSLKKAPFCSKLQGIQPNTGSAGGYKSRKKKSGGWFN